MKILFITFGCRLNRAEALKDEARYLAAGYERAENVADADWVIVRGCSVTARAQHNCEKLIDRIARDFPGKRVAVTGCLNVKGAAKPPRIVRKLDGSQVPVRTARAFLKVQDGCNGQCSFCIIPKFRGKSLSVAFNEVLDEAKRFIDAGYHEIVVTGCNLVLYNSDQHHLPELVAALSDLSCETRIRLGSIEPGPCAKELIDLMAERANICRFIHLPIQSGSDVILKAMRRPYRVRDVDALLHHATRAIPRLGIGCDIMVGFPTESDLDFLATQSLLSRHPFSKAHIFPFSERPGTRAASMVCPVDAGIRSLRAHDLAELMEEKRDIICHSFLGHTVEVLIESDVKHCGWTGEYLPCDIIRHTKKKPIRRKELVSAKVIDVVDGRLVAAQII